jgi:hypothetical protein
VLAWIGLRTPLTYMRPMDPETVEVFLYRPPPPPSPRSGSGQAPPSPPALYRPRVSPSVAPTTVESIPAPPAQPAGPPGPAAKPAPAILPAPWDGLRAAVRGSPAGCANRDVLGMNAQERAVCDERLGAAGGGKMLPLGIDPLKQAGFDAAAAAKARDRRGREGSMGQPMTACAGRASNFGVGCTPEQ